MISRTTFATRAGRNTRIAGINQVPCWVRELDDATAYMMLVTCNTQGELTALERGLHALRSTMGVREYARAVACGPDQITRERAAAEVVLACANTIDPSAKDVTRHLAEIHAAPAWLWPALVAAMLPSRRALNPQTFDGHLTPRRYKGPPRAITARDRWKTE